MRRILVTGANKGIGRAIAQAILEKHDDTFVYVGTRDLERGRAAVDVLGQPSRTEVLPLDVADDRSVLAARERVQGPLYGIVNNAGVGGASELSDTINVNVLRVQRVCEAFLPLLDPEHGRIVNVTSAAGPSFVATCSAAKQRFFLDPNGTWSGLRAFIDECLGIAGDAAAFAARGLGDGQAYGLSKACANLYTLLLAREHPELKINACTPGFIETDLTRGFVAGGKSAAEMGMKPPAAGAVAPLHLLFGELEGNGRYYGSDAKRSPLDRYRSPGSAPYAGD